MNLITDIGNSSTKVALYDKHRKLSVTRYDNFTEEELGKILAGSAFEKAIVSSVRDIPPFITELIPRKIPLLHILTHRSRLPFSIDYETPESLGPDRIASAAGALSIFPGKDILIIDAGTAITFDYIRGNIYMGGNISPGLYTRLRALNAFTGRLPMVSPEPEFTNPGRNTKDAILAGVITGIIFEINEYIRTFEKNNVDFKIILTGGDGEFLKDRIRLKYIYMPDIVIDGLNYILEYNAA